MSQSIAGMKERVIRRRMGNKNEQAVMVAKVVIEARTKDTSNEKKAGKQTMARLTTSDCREQHNSGSKAATEALRAAAAEGLSWA